MMVMVGVASDILTNKYASHVAVNWQAKSEGLSEVCK